MSNSNSQKSSIKLRPWQQALWDDLQTIKGSGNYHATGKVDFFVPRISVMGVGELKFPLTTDQAAALIGVAEVAPHGQGTKTVYDENVRKCWQIDARQISIKSAKWTKFLSSTITTIKESMGISGTVEAHPYKLLLYGPGGHFRAHRDTEKLEAMFGSLIIALPSKHTGGVLKIRHHGTEQIVDFSEAEGEGCFQYAAFFADCEHEVLKVESGYRFCLAYNLVLAKGDPALLNPPHAPWENVITERLTAAAEMLAAEKELNRLCAVMLEHNYTEANLAVGNLKGNDLLRAQVLFRCADNVGMSAYLALLTLYRQGDLEGYDPGDDDDWDSIVESDPEAGTMGEVIEESLTLSCWRDHADQAVPLGKFSIDVEVIISDGAIDSGNPSEQAAQGFTGNEGCTMEHWYRRAAIVLWPRHLGPQILCIKDLAAACAMLHSLAGEPATEAKAAFAKFAEMAALVYTLRINPKEPWRLKKADDQNPINSLLSGLISGGATGLIARLLKELPFEVFIAWEQPLWEQFAKEAEPKLLRQVRDSILTHKGMPHRRTSFQLLSALASARDAKGVSAVAEHILNLPLWDPSTSDWNNKEHLTPDPSAEAVIWLRVSHLLRNKATRDKVLARLLGSQSLAYFRKTLLPALFSNETEAARKAPTSLVPEVAQQAIALLEKECAKSIQPYPDWKRPFPGDSTEGGLSKKDWSELAAFMANPSCRIHEFARPKATLNLLVNYILEHQLDISHTFAHDSREKYPSLVLQKTSKSHDELLRVRQEDTANLAKLLERRPLKH